MAISAQTDGNSEAAGARRLRLRPALSWPCIVALAALLRLLATGVAVLNDPDTYWHLTVGNWIAEALDHRTDTATLKKIRKQVEELAEQFPLYPERRASSIAQSRA